MIHFDRDIYYDKVRHTLFGGSMTQGQVSGQEQLLQRWETIEPNQDLRFFSYMLATTKHETANEMAPISEMGHGEGHSYGEVDPETKQTYFGRGYVQLTWRENYRYATMKLDLSGDDDLEWHADRALDPVIAADVMFRGMIEGWFRAPNKLSTFFSSVADDGYGAREIINGDKHLVPSWSGGISIGTMIANYHEYFLDALVASSAPQVQKNIVSVAITVPDGVELAILINGIPVIMEEDHA